MTVSVAIGADPKDIENIKKIQQVISEKNTPDYEQVKEWVNDIYFVLTNYKHFATS